jgi:hypothetical protein
MYICWMLVANPSIGVLAFIMDRVSCLIQNLLLLLYIGGCLCNPPFFLYLLYALKGVRMHECCPAGCSIGTRAF